MAFDFSPTALVNAGGALMFFLEGIFILAVSRGNRRARLIGVCATAFGLAFILQNLLPVLPTSPDTNYFVVLAVVLLASAAALALAWNLSRQGPLPERRLWGILGLLLLAATALLTTVQASVPIAGASWVAVFGAAYFGFLHSSFVLLLAAGAVALRGLDVKRALERRALLLMSIAFGLWTLKQVLQLGVIPFVDITPTVALRVADAAFFVFALLAIAAAVLYVPRAADQERRLWRNGALALAGTGVAAVGMIALVTAFRGVVAAQGDNFGDSGIVRTVGAVLLAIAVLKYDLLGVPLPKFAVKRGAVAAGALALLFIVAQVAQNFLSAQYGLLTGGIVAGTFLFAANPIQKRIERIGDRQARTPTTADGSGNDDSFREAVELAFKDRRFTPQEELALARLATRLGVSAERATEIRHAVEGKVR